MSAEGKRPATPLQIQVQPDHCGGFYIYDLAGFHLFGNTDVGHARTARLIVTAVNAHEGLVEALRYAESLLIQLEECGSMRAGCMCPVCRRAISDYFAKRPNLGELLKREVPCQK